MAYCWSCGRHFQMGEVTQHHCPSCRAQTKLDIFLNKEKLSIEDGDTAPIGSSDSE